jgi:predicted nucleotidyltransferase
MEREDIQSWGRAIAEREAARYAESHRRCQARRRAGREAAARIARLLAGEPGVRKVILFGSLAGTDGLVHEGSDIDLAVSGLPEQSETSAWKIAQDATHIRVDLVRLESVPGRMRERIEREGEVLHDTG